MVDSTDDKGSTQAQDNGANDTTADAGADSKGVQFSAEQQAYLNKLMADARREGRESEKKKYADYADAKAKAAKLEEIEKAKLSEEEQKKAELDRLQKLIDDKDKVLAERNLRDLKRTKIEQAIADGKMELPKGKTIDSLVKRMLGTTEEEIDSDIEDLAGFFPKSEPSKGIGSGTQTPPAAKPPDVKEQIAALTQQAIDPKLTPIERGRIQDQILALKMKAGGFVIA